jgi:hypothetical protein
MFHLAFSKDTTSINMNENESATGWIKYVLENKKKFELCGLAELR